MSAWPTPHDPEYLFTKALLLCGPLPTKGWHVVRDCYGTIICINYRGKENRMFANAVSDMLADEVRRRYAARRWTDYHCLRLGQNWKNLFLKWVWEKIDET